MSKKKKSVSQYLAILLITFFSVPIDGALLLSATKSPESNPPNDQLPVLLRKLTKIEKEIKSRNQQGGQTSDEQKVCWLKRSDDEIVGDVVLMSDETEIGVYKIASDKWKLLNKLTFLIQTRKCTSKMGCTAGPNKRYDYNPDPGYYPYSFFLGGVDIAVFKSFIRAEAFSDRARGMGICW